ncbi:hypothetical protein B0J11DRAFT_615215 [Dendryphion nanum]|uniref:Uncharacterized protein n=1 Tax=Dendryphion nanum TaxID=256645 RepID=A0A9P9DRE5_9PLEO|nr:hypothetical protein B0J11DRAFT_615215 [Dendryphion nanum]
MTILEMASLRRLDDVERQATINTAATMPIIEPTPTTSDVPLVPNLVHGFGLQSPPREGQFCFICLRTEKLGQFAVEVPCFRRFVGDQSGSIESRVYESDTAIYQRMNDFCYKHLGKWKRWIPYYGIVDVHEVNFQFLGASDRKGSFPVHIYPVDLDRAREEAKEGLKFGPDDEYQDYCREGYHCKKCSYASNMSYNRGGNHICFKDLYEIGQEWIKKLDVLYLLRDCARQPWIANGLRTLDGMAQGSCIVDTSSVKIPGLDNCYLDNGKLRGLEFVFGWQIDRIRHGLPLNITWIWISVLIVWICAIAFGGFGGDWNLGMAFGQLLAASLTLLFLYAKH